MKHAGYLLAATLLSATPATAQIAAVRDINGHLFCNDDHGVDLREKTGGGYAVSISFEFFGDPDKAVYAPGQKALFALRTELRSYITTGYQFTLDASGNPVARPQPYRLGVSTGRFDGPRLEPIESLGLTLKAGEKSAPIGINSAFFNIALVAGDIGVTGSENPYDTEMTQSALDDLVTALDHEERWIVLSQYDQEVARIPVPQRNILGERDKKIAYVRSAVSLLKKDKCPA